MPDAVSGMGSARPSHSRPHGVVASKLAYWPGGHWFDFTSGQN